MSLFQGDRWFESISLQRGVCCEPPASRIRQAFSSVSSGQLAPPHPEPAPTVRPYRLGDLAGHPTVVDGNATLSLDVPLDQVDDILKSLVVCHIGR
jgi:hypothetical protein